MEKIIFHLIYINNRTSHYEKRKSHGLDSVLMRKLDVSTNGHSYSSMNLLDLSTSKRLPSTHVKKVRVSQKNNPAEKNVMPAKKKKQPRPPQAPPRRSYRQS
jgi:hypothetical protein